MSNGSRLATTTISAWVPDRTSGCPVAASDSSGPAPRARPPLVVTPPAVVGAFTGPSRADGCAVPAGWPRQRSTFSRSAQFPTLATPSHAIGAWRVTGLAGRPATNPRSVPGRCRVGAGSARSVAEGVGIGAGQPGQPGHPPPVLPHRLERPLLVLADQ